jgi:hypothetical protein
MLVGSHPITAWRMTSSPGKPILPAGQPQRLLSGAVEEVNSQSVVVVQEYAQVPYYYFLPRSWKNWTTSARAVPARASAKIHTLEVP